MATTTPQPASQMKSHFSALQSVVLTTPVHPHTTPQPASRMKSHFSALNSVVLMTPVYPHGYHNTTTCLMDEKWFISLHPSLKIYSMKSACHVYYFVNGHKTHNASLMTHSNVGCMTHNMAGYLTQHISYASFIQCSYCLMPCCISSLPVGVSSKQHRNAGTSCGVTKKPIHLVNATVLSFCPIPITCLKRLETIQLFVSNSI